MDRDEYEATKKVALRKLKRRLLFLSIFDLIFSFVLAIIGLVVNNRYPNATGMSKKVLGVKLRSLYYTTAVLLFVR